MKKKIAAFFVLALLFSAVLPLNMAFATAIDVIINAGNEGTPFDLSTMTDGQSVLVNTTEVVELTGDGGDITITCIEGTQVTLIDVTISSSYCPIAFDGVGNTLNLEGISTLIAESSYSAVNVPFGTQLTIIGDGTLNATGGSITSSFEGGAGIGGNSSQSSGEIIIQDGKVKATPGYDAAGIGGGSGGAGFVTITGGTIETITVEGTEAGIGSGYNGTGGEVNISGGLIIARAGKEDAWGERAAAIGASTEGSFGNINITGGQIYAIGVDGTYDDIGAGNNSTCGSVTISNSAAVFLYHNNIGNLSTSHIYVNSEAVTSNTAYGFDNFPDDFNDQIGYGYLKEANITYNYSDVSQPDSTITVWCGNELTEPSAPTKLGYAFNGWHYDIAGKLPYIFDGTPVSGDLTLYAHWVESGTHSGRIAGSLVDDSNSPIEGYYATLQSRPITVSTSSAGAFAFGSVYYVNHTLIIKDDVGTIIRTYNVNFVEGTTSSAVVDEGSSTITVVYNGNVTSINIPLSLDASGTTATVTGPVTFTETSSSGGFINPQTGDNNSNNYLYVIVSAVLLIGILIRKKTLS